MRSNHNTTHTHTHTQPLTTHAKQDKDALPKGRLSDTYDEGVLFVTYSLLAMGSQVDKVKSGVLAKALQVGWCVVK